NSYAAQGGVAAAVGPGDDPALHAADTLSAGRGLCRPSAVRLLTDEAPARASCTPAARTPAVTSRTC
ncbi:MAG TPA: FAD-binding protein, partial [Gaiellaceae bacterium]|nr:FAD-binding protein [Gaiellaceae bacterium]